MNMKMYNHPTTHIIDLRSLDEMCVSFMSANANLSYQGEGDPSEAM